MDKKHGVFDTIQKSKLVFKKIGLNRQKYAVTMT
jgi:hypothetical protein